MTRIQPRRLAPIILGVGNIASGIAGLVSHDTRVPAYQHLTTVMPLHWWWTGFIILGAMILIGPFHREIAQATMLAALAWWVFFAVLIAETVSSPLVSGRAIVMPLWMAALHLLLSPYRRDLA